MAAVAYPQEYARRRTWPTPLAHDNKPPSPAAFLRKSPGLAAEVVRHDTSTTRGDGGSGRRGNVPRLNPDWVEWLMFWPVGWTDPVRTVGLAWLDPSRDPADLPPHDAGLIPRVTLRRADRCARLRAIGNGQFPPTACVMSEWGFAMLDALEGPPR